MILINFFVCLFFKWKQKFVNQICTLPPITAHIPIIISVENNWNTHFSTILCSSIFKQCFSFTDSVLKLSLMLCRMDVSKLWAPGPFCLEVKVEGYGKRERTNFTRLYGEKTDRRGMERVAKRHLWEAGHEKGVTKKWGEWLPSMHWERSQWSKWASNKLKMQTHYRSAIRTV